MPRMLVPNNTRPRKIASASTLAKKQMPAGYRLDREDKDTTRSGKRRSHSKTVAAPITTKEYMT
jgi:hypothetical protein